MIDYWGNVQIQVLSIQWIMTAHDFFTLITDVEQNVYDLQAHTMFTGFKSQPSQKLQNSRFKVT